MPTRNVSVPAPRTANHIFRRQRSPARSGRVRTGGHAAPAGSRALPTASHSLPLAGRSAEILQLQRLVGNQAVQRLLVQREDTPAVAEPESVTGFVGMNPKAYIEARRLEKKAKGKVITSLNVDGAELDYGTDEQRLDFVIDQLGYAEGTDINKILAIYHTLEEADPGFREQMADMLRLFAGADRGQYRLERLVMSGHSNGMELWGEKETDTSAPGKFIFNRDFRNLGKAFPTVAAQVQDIMFSACFSLGAVKVVTEVFPNLESVWTYSAFSPSIDQGSARHITDWEKRTRGDDTPGKKDKRGSAAIWTKEGGFIVGDPAKADFQGLLTSLGSIQPQVRQMYRGEIPLQGQVLREYYLTLQRIAAHPGCDEETRGNAESGVNKVLRLRFWSLVTSNFATTYKLEIKEAYEELELTVPALATISRPDLKTHKEAYAQALTTKSAPKAQAFYDNLLLKGLWELDPDIIKSEWI